MTHEPDGLTGSDDRRRAIADPRELRRPPVRTLDLEEQRQEMCGDAGAPLVCLVLLAGRPVSLAVQ
jgi:hypothetical protein